MWPFASPDRSFETAVVTDGLCLFDHLSCVDLLSQALRLSTVYMLQRAPERRCTELRTVVIGQYLLTELPCGYQKQRLPAR